MHGDAALLLQQIERIERQQAAVPLRAGVGLVPAALGGEIAAGCEGVVGDRLQRFVVEVDGVGRIERDALFVERVLQPHHAEADGAVAEVRAAPRRRPGRS